MPKIIMNLCGADLDFIKDTKKQLDTKEYALVSITNSLGTMPVTMEELSQYILLLELSKDGKT